MNLELAEKLCGKHPEKFRIERSGMFTTLLCGGRRVLCFVYERELFGTTQDGLDRLCASLGMRFLLVMDWNRTLRVHVYDSIWQPLWDYRHMKLKSYPQLSPP